MAKDEVAAAAKGADKAPEATADATADVTAAPGPAKKGSRKLLIIGLVAVLVLGGGGAAAWLLMSGSKTKPAAAAAAEDATDAEADTAEAPEAPTAAGGAAQYLGLNPAFVVNLNDDEAMRYLQLEIELMSRDASALEAVNKHMPVIRNNLLLLFGQQRFHDIDTREGKERLRAEALAEVQKVLTEQTGSPGIEQLYFTSLVMQ